MPNARAMTGYGGSLTFKAGTGSVVVIKVRDVKITRQSSEFDLTAHGDTKTFSGPGRVKRGGSLEAYISADTVGFTTAVETPDLINAAVLVWTDASGVALTMNVIVTGADQTHSSSDAAIYSITFTETILLATT